MSDNGAGHNEVLQSLKKVTPLPIDLNDVLLKEGAATYDILNEQGHDLFAAHIVGLEIQNCGDLRTILTLWEKRIGSLLKASMEIVVKEEAKALGHLSSEHYRSDDGTCFAPWDLRVLLVPFQQTSSQACLGKWYVLAREARTEAAKARKNASTGASQGGGSSDLWDNRLAQLGFYVTATLLSLRDYSTAIEHLKSFYATCVKKLPPNQALAHRIAQTLALVCLQIGETISAREWFSKAGPDQQATAMVSKGICSLADADWQAAITQLAELEVESGTAANGLAVAQVHQGQYKNGIESFEKAARMLNDTQPRSSTTRLVMSNLFSLYDLNESASAENRAKWRTNLSS